MAVEVSREGAVAVVTVNRPEALNALNSETNEALLATVRELSPDDAVRAVVLTGGGDKAFVAGADIAEMSGLSAEQARRFGALGQAVMSGIEAAPQPWIAAVNGFALGGGCELALACDIRLASDKAKFGQPEINLGITPGFGGTQRLPRNVGEGWAKYLVLSGRIIRADEALRIGLVQAVFPKDELDDPGDEAGRGARRQEPAGDALLQGGRQRRRRHRPRDGTGDRARPVRAGVRDARTRPRAWPRSSRSGRRSSAAAEPAAGRPGPAPGTGPVRERRPPCRGATALRGRPAWRAPARRPPP